MGAGLAVGVDPGHGHQLLLHAVDHWQQGAGQRRHSAHHRRLQVVDLLPHVAQQAVHPQALLFNKDKAVTSFTWHSQLFIHRHSCATPQRLHVIYMAAHPQTLLCNNHNVFMSFTCFFHLLKDTRELISARNT